MLAIINSASNTPLNNSATVTTATNSATYLANSRLPRAGAAGWTEATSFAARSAAARNQLRPGKFMRRHVTKCAKVLSLG